MIILSGRGYSWQGRLDVAAALRMRDVSGIDIMRLGREYQRQDMETAVAGLYAIMLPQLGGMRPSKFGKILRYRSTPDVVASAFLEGLIAFFEIPGPSPESKATSQDVQIDLWQELWRAAGAVGVNPLPLTLGELIAMRDGRYRLEWPQSASIMAAIVNSLTHDSHKRVNPADLDPSGYLKESSRRRGSNSRELTPDNLFSFASMIMR